MRHLRELSLGRRCGHFCPTWAKTRAISPQISTKFRIFTCERKNSGLLHLLAIAPFVSGFGEGNNRLALIVILRGCNDNQILQITVVIPVYIGVRRGCLLYRLRIGQGRREYDDIHQIHTVLDATDTADLADIRSMGDAFAHEDPQMRKADNGQLWRDLARRIGGVDSPRTQAVFGVIGQRKATATSGVSLELSSMRVQSNTDLATIALSSLTNDPIEKSDSMLLSAVGRASNRGQRMDGEKLLDIGTGPIEAEMIDAVISIKTDNTKLRVWTINSEGFYAGNPQVTHANGWMTFHIGPNYPGLYYLIMEY